MFNRLNCMFTRPGVPNFWPIPWEKTSWKPAAFRVTAFEKEVLSPCLSTWKCAQIWLNMYTHKYIYIHKYLSVCLSVYLSIEGGREGGREGMHACISWTSPPSSCLYSSGSSKSTKGQLAGSASYLQPSPTVVPAFEICSRLSVTTHSGPTGKHPRGRP